jgi:hypothetical protein
MRALRVQTLRMTSPNAVAFLVLGLAIWFTPTLAPEFFPLGSGSDFSPSASWLKVMGLTNGTVGGSWICRHQLVPFLVRFFRTRESASSAGFPAETAALLEPVE